VSPLLKLWRRMKSLPSILLLLERDGEISFNRSAQFVRRTRRRPLVCQIFKRLGVKARNTFVDLLFNACVCDERKSAPQAILREAFCGEAIADFSFFALLSPWSGLRQ
jgi:hypothetical protein